MVLFVQSFVFENRWNLSEKMDTFSEKEFLKLTR